MMADLFIYVFTVSARDTLLKAGYQLVSSDERNETYTFLQGDGSPDALSEISYLTGNTLTL